MRSIFGDPSRPLVGGETEDFFRGCFRFNLSSSLLGTCTSEHEKVSYHEGGLSHPGAQNLAILASYLVDGSKQGDFLSNKDWQKFRNAISPVVREKPAYKESEKKVASKESSVIDFLKFAVATPERDKTLTEFNDKWPQKHSGTRDPALTDLWRATRQEASAELGRVLDQLQKDVDDVGEEWTKSMPKVAKFKGNGFHIMVASLHQKFSGIEPVASKHEMTARWISETKEAFGHWRLLRASCLYNKCPNSKMCWYLAGQDLCWIKINATGPSRAVLQELYNAYRPDKKTVMRLVGQEDDEDDTEEVADE
jgi:hypothetical protein